MLYQRVLVEIMHCGDIIKNERTGMEVRQRLDYPFTYSVFVRSEFPLLQNRKYYPYIAAAETAWQLSGQRHTKLINKYAPKLWSKFEEDITYHADKEQRERGIRNAQGYRWRHHFGRDQIAAAVRRIRSHPTDRQIVISSWDPEVDGLGSERPNTHCLPLMSLRPDIINEQLHMTVISRSADMVLGFPYDLYNYTFLLHAFARSTGLRAGYLSIVLNNYHVYMLEDHIDVVTRVIAETNMTDNEIFWFPMASISDIMNAPETYIEKVKEKMKASHLYAPKIELVV